MPTKKKAEAKPAEPTCLVEDCDNEVFVRGLCEQHWADPAK